MDKRPKAISLFSGCGGLDLGLTEAGFDFIYANEINETCALTYKKNFNIDDSSFFLGDVRELVDKVKKKEIEFEDIDLVCGGPPCQGFSMANRQRVIDDPRNILYKTYLDFLGLVNPKIFIMENVKGMMNKIPEIIDDFHNALGDSYIISYRLLNAKDFGVPQNRERLIVVGNRLGIETETLFNSLANNTYPRFVLKDALEGLPELEPNRTKNNSSLENDEIGYFKTSFSYLKNRYYKFINGDRDIDFLYNHKNRYNNDRDIEIFRRLPQGANSLHESIADIMPYKSRNDIFKDKYFKLNENEVCKTITSHMKFDCNMYIHPSQARGLSPREAARIQTFPDDFVFYGPQNSWYMQIGNAVPVILAQAIGEEIIKWI